MVKNLEPSENVLFWDVGIKEYDLSYIDIQGETHILYNTMYPIFTEKSYQPIFFEKMFLLYGGNCFYEVLDKLGGHNFKDELLLPDTYFTMNNPYEQIDTTVMYLYSR